MNYQTTELWDLVTELRKEKKEKDRFQMKFQPEYKETENKKLPRMIPNEKNINPLELSNHYVADVRNLLKNEKLKTKKKLEAEMNLKIQQNPKYFDELLTKYKTSKQKNFQEFLEEEIENLLKDSEKREFQTKKSLEFLSEYFLDRRDIQPNIPEDLENFEYKKIQRMVYNDRVMSVFKGKEKIFEDPFGIGLEPSLQPFDPYQFDNVIFNEEKDVKINKNQNEVPKNDVDYGSSFQNFLQKF
eukprot:gene4733-8316_t